MTYPFYTRNHWRANGHSLYIARYNPSIWYLWIFRVFTKDLLYSGYKISL